MSEPNSPVDPEDLELLRAAGKPSPAACARVRSRLALVIPMGGGGSSMGGGPAPKGALPGMAAARSLRSYGMSAAAFLTGGVVGAAIYAGFARPPPPRVVYVDRPVVLSAPSAAPPLEEPPRAAQTAPMAEAPSAPHASSFRGHASQLSAERILLDEARAAIAQGDAQRGLDRIERHRRLFPNALLAEERDALQVQALVKAGRYEEARSHADSFRKRTPGSLFLPMVDAAIASIP